MARLEPIAIDQAQGRARELLDELAARGGEPGPMVRTMANAPAVLRGYLDLSRAMKRSHLDRRITERIALAVQQWIGCDYCLAAHSAAAEKLGITALMQLTGAFNLVAGIHPSTTARSAA